MILQGQEDILQQMAVAAKKIYVDLPQGSEITITVTLPDENHAYSR
jgi:hypothetical protein